MLRKYFLDVLDVNITSLSKTMKISYKIFYPVNKLDVS